ncbi:uncharacterized protein PAC_05409 [Phialocephala subalpina]|uniref:Uncharacterized protein n=1 Tax=Phialocephala subalpina TaxID=576137 RepID=A0A1L7WRX7_9HELO|nr:uncharacterized protein PAC_05409 [Phialocephala subalpina]
MMNEQVFRASNGALRDTLANASIHIDPSRPSAALLVTWEGAPNSEQVEAARVCAALEEGFGYKGISLRLPQTDPEAALISQVQSLLKDAELALNPFVVYYRGNGFIKNRKPFWRLGKSSAAVDWLNIQALLENGKPDTILALDCDYGVIPTMNRDGEGQSAFCLASTRKSGGKTGKLEIIAAPQRSQNIGQSFSQTLAGALEERQGSPFSLDRLLADLQKIMGDVIHKNLSAVANGGKIKITPVCPLVERPNRSKTSGASHGNQDKEIAAAAQKWTEDSRWSTVLPAREGYYKKVVVLPIAWEISDWDAKRELEDLKTAFETNFNYQVEETFLISDDANAQQAIETKIGYYVDRALINALSHNDLLIVLYNGHGMDGYKNGCNMMWEGGKQSSHRVPINWTKVVHKLDTAPCDVVQILDCCYGATAIKSKVMDETKMLDHIHQKTPESEYRGRNEILASCGRDNETAAGSSASMPLFAEVLHTLASKNLPLSIYSWFHEIDSEVVRRNTQNIPDTQYPRWAQNWYYSPSWKCHPKEIWPRSIVLRPKSATGISESQSSSASGYIYAKIKIEQGRPADVSYYTEEGTR